MRKLAAAALLALAAAATAADVPNGSFEDGRDGPTGWKATGAGRWLEGDAAAGRRAVAATGSGTDSSGWVSQSISLEPAAVYCLRFRARSQGASGGTAVTGPTYCNRDLGLPPGRWTRYEAIFITPDDASAGRTRLRLGQWHVRGTVAFDDVRLLRAAPAYTVRGPIRLGAGESLRPPAEGSGCEYVFAAPLGGRGANHSRPLARHRCPFHSNRWWLHAGSEVVYRHEVGTARQAAARVEVGVTWHAAGRLVVQAGRDGRRWQELGTLEGLGQRTFEIPPALLPARQVWVRLTARPGAKGEEDISFQVSRYVYTARLEHEPVTMNGRTDYLLLGRVDAPLAVAAETLGAGIPGGENAAVLRVTNGGREAIAGTLTTTTVAPDGSARRQARPVTLLPGASTVRAAYELGGAGRWRLEVALDGPVGFAAECAIDVPALHDASYGLRLAGGGEKAQLWWASSGWKVSRLRPAPKARGEAVVIRTARNEAEAAQLVIRPTVPLRALRAEATALLGPGGAKIPAGRVEILRVRYVRVTQPTDRTGCVGDWPDPLPPFAAPVDLRPGRNQPLWIRVRPPRGIPGGTYRGQVRLAAEGFAAAVPLEVVVWDFDLPDRMTCSTAFGLSVGNIWRYHRLTDPADRRAVLEKYLANFSAHHVSPYDPAPLDPLRVTWPDLGPWQGGTRDRIRPHSGRASLKLADTSTTASASASYRKPVKIPAGGLRLRLWHRAAKGHPFLVTLNHHDAAGRWMRGRNNDLRIVGTGDWAEFDRTIRRFPEGAASVRLTLWPCLYSADGKTTGVVWYDDLSLTDAAGGESLVVGGDFEPPDPARLKPKFDFTAWDRAMERAIDHYHFNSFHLRVPGLGGGSFHARYEPNLLGFSEDTPEYKALLASWCRQVQEHLREKGWLDEAFVYWFDEPAPKDYAFVRNGFAKLKAFAPDLRRMLTEQVEDALIGGPNIWCPVTPNFDPARAAERRKAGEAFWWYVCTGPKAPFCTLFIDHPATEMRVWLWQTWQRRIEGILVWQTNYWTSTAAYPDPARPQNPYEDPMGWTSGYSTPRGVRRPWGNGDGRFVYPPEAAASGNPPGPVLAGPVDSIRWEMLRDGIEDYEYHAILRRLLAGRGGALPAARREALERLLEVPAEVTSSMTAFTKDPAPIERRREALARAIEALSRGR